MQLTPPQETPSLELISAANGVVKGSFNKPFCY